MFLRNDSDYLPDSWRGRLSKELHGTEFYLEILIVPQFVKKLPAVYGARRFVTSFTRFRYLSLF